MAADLELIDFDSSWLDELIPMWRASFEDGVGIRDPHPLEDQRSYFETKVLPSNAVRLAMDQGVLVGFVAASRDSIVQLYVRTGCQRRGVGSLMLEWAKAQSGGRLWLYAFARNSRARAFYEKHGFVAVAFGFEPMWQLDDVRYEWNGG